MLGCGLICGFGLGDFRPDLRLCEFAPSKPNAFSINAARHCSPITNRGSSALDDFLCTALLNIEASREIRVYIGHVQAQYLCLLRRQFVAQCVGQRPPC